MRDRLTHDADDASHVIVWLDGYKFHTFRYDDGISVCYHGKRMAYLDAETPDSELVGALRETFYDELTEEVR